MKHLDSSLFCYAMFASGLVLGSAFLGCNERDRQEAKTAAKDTYDDSKAALSKAWADMKNYSFERRNDFTAGAEAARARMDEQVSRLRADYSEAKASASRKAAMEELRNSEVDYREKLSALGAATADTWDSAKKNLQLAWDRLEAAYYKARAD